MEEIFFADEGTLVLANVPTGRKSLAVTGVTSERKVEKECPMSGDEKRSFSEDSEKCTCPFCGVEYDKEGPHDWRDPEWYYTHPKGVRTMTEVVITALVGTPR